MIAIYLSLIDSETDKIKFQEIYENYKKQMWYVANDILNDAYLAEDAVHDAFIGIAKNFSKIRSFEPYSIKSYVLTSARRAALMYVRKEKGYETIDISEIFNLKDYSSTNKMNEIETIDFATAIINSLPPKYSETMYLHFVLDLSAKEIATQLDRNINTVRQQISRGRRMFIDIISRGEETSDKQ